MNGNMRLHINDAVLHNAFLYAEEKGVDLSVVVENFLKRLTISVKKEDKITNFPVSPKVKSLAGRVKIKSGSKDWEHEKDEYFKEKYGL